MNPELKERLTKYLDALETGVAKAGEFVGGEIEQTVKEFVAWRSVESFSSAAGLLVSAAVLFLFVRRWPARIAAWAREKNYTWENDPPMFFGLGGAWLLKWLVPVILLTCAFGQVQRGVKVLVAPRVVLLEEVSAVVTGMKEKK